MNPNLLVVGLAAALPLLAQGPLPSPIQAIREKAAVTRNCGLQPARGTDGWIGIGADYRVTFTAQRVHHEPALGEAAPTTQHFDLGAATVRRGSTRLATQANVAPQGADRRVSYQRAPGVVERFDVRPEGVALSWQFAEQPAGEGDLVVHYAVDTSLGEPSVHGDGLRFARAFGGVTIGGATGIDAAGHTVPGAVQWVDGGLQLSLPATFVATATYPIVLDPLIGTTFPIVSGLSTSDREPDAAYDDSSGKYLVVWQRVYSATDSDTVGQLVNTAGLLSGGLIAFDTTVSQTSPPRVAHSKIHDCFGVVYTITNAAGTLHRVLLETLTTPSSFLAQTLTVASSTTNPFQSPDIGGHDGDAGAVVRGFVVTYEDDDLGAIRARRIFFDPFGTLTGFNAFSIWTDTVLGSTYTAPAISRAADSDGDLLVVAKRYTPLLGGSAIVATVVNTGTNALGASTTVETNAANSLSRPDVDGFARKWVVAYERSPSNTAVVVTPVSFDAATSALVVGAGVVAAGGGLFSQAHAPTVGYTPGRTWLGYQLVNTLAASTTLRIAAIDSGSCVSCNDSFVAPTQGGTRIVVATATSSGFTIGEQALCVWHASLDDIDAQLVTSTGTTGSLVGLGGACGQAGSVGYGASPSIGSSGFSSSVLLLPPTALATIFNFSTPTSAIPCGPCVWTPFSVTVNAPIVNNAARVEFPIPCLQTLVGLQFEMQWTVIDLTQAPCPAFPGLSLSNRVLMTVGQ